MDFYSRLQSTANRLLKGKGQPVTITSQIVGVYDPATGSASVSTSIQTGWGAVFEYTNKNIDGTLILAGDKQLLLSAINSAGALLAAPQVNDTVTIGGQVSTIKQVKPLSPAGTALLFDCNIRGVS